jgi:hypothetical protein
MNHKILDPIFNAYLSAGRELEFRELLQKYPKELKEVKRRYPALTVKKIVRMVRKIYSSRWHEIQPKPPIASASILEKMRIASSRK